MVDDCTLSFPRDKPGETSNKRFLISRRTAVTGYGLHTSKGSTIVEAAHIHSFSKSRNDNPDNGLALTRDAHWMLDEGLWSLDEKHRIHVASEIFTEWGNEVNWLKARHGKACSFLEGVALRPAKEHLAWHRANVFAG